MICFIFHQECLCTAHGDPHYRLFNGVNVDFMGECQYVFSKTKDILDGDVCQYHIEVFNYKKDENKRATYTKGVIVEFTYFQESFRFERGQPIKVFWVFLLLLLFFYQRICFRTLMLIDKLFLAIRSISWMHGLM